MSNFYQSLNFGKVGEAKTINMLRNRGWKITDVSDKHYSYDLLATKHDRTLSIEVKRQSAIVYGNICLEIDQVNKPGWFKKIIADKIIFTYDNTFIVIDVDDLRRAYAKYQPTLKTTSEGKKICFLDIALLRGYESFQEIYWNEDLL